MRTQVAIIGGGPSGLLLAQLLYQNGIDTIVLERQTKDYVLGRIRAGILERGLVDLMHEAGCGARLAREGILHHGTQIAYDDAQFGINFHALTGHNVVVYGQTEVTRDLYAAREETGGQTLFQVDHVTLTDLDTHTPLIRFEHQGAAQEIKCDFIAGCDGFHGVTRQTIPLSVRKEYEKIYPFGWLGVLSRTPPVNDELIYASSSRGFALCSMRNANLSRYYIQCALSDHADDWTDAAFWQELKRRLPQDVSERLVTGASIEKSIAPLRSFVTEPMQSGRLFLCGDAAHIVPPTGAKGLNTAASDVYYLSRGLIAHYREKDDEALQCYSERALARVWKVERFSWNTTNMLHRFPDHSAFDLKMQQADIAFLRSNKAAQQAFAENYVGLSYDM